MRTLERHSILPLSYLTKLKNFVVKKEYCIIDGVSVKITSQRYAVFQKSTECCECGLVGSFLAVERDEKMKPKPSKHFHINMYGVDTNGKEILMTKDHIKPKSKGGKSEIDNYQTMCTSCNLRKKDIFSNKTKIYLDMDGVFCDFQKRFNELLIAKGEEPMGFEEHGLINGWSVTWKIIEDAGVNFWKNLKWTNDGKQLWSHLKSYNNKEILTGLPRGLVGEYSKEGKLNWVRKNLSSNIKINCTFGKFKYKYVTNGEILIDDSERNCKAWEDAGGKAILHQNTEDTIIKLKELISNE